MKPSVRSQLAADRAQLLRRIAALESQRSHLLHVAAAHPGANAVARLMPLLLRPERQIDHLQALAGLASAQQQRLERLSVNVALVEYVPDGDGLELADGRRVRYLGIDAPDTRYAALLARCQAAAQAARVGRLRDGA